MYLGLLVAAYPAVDAVNSPRPAATNPRFRKADTIKTFHGSVQADKAVGLEQTVPRPWYAGAWRTRDGCQLGRRASDQKACDWQCFNLAYLCCLSGQVSFAPEESE